jgi:biotin transporter BioY
MYIVAIAWLYVTVLMAATEVSITAGLLTFIFYGLLPCALFVWIFGAPQRKRTRQKNEARLALEHELGQPDGTDTKNN